MKNLFKIIPSLLMLGGLSYGVKLLVEQVTDYKSLIFVIPAIATITFFIFVIALGSIDELTSGAISRWIARKRIKRELSQLEDSPVDDGLQSYLGGMSRVMGRSFERATVPNVKLDDVAGIEEVKDRVSIVVDFLKNPRKYQALGAKLPRGILLSGEPGVGKTLLAKAIAGEAEVPFYSASGSDFVEMFAGVGASRIRELFAQAAAEPTGAIIFIDEIDAIGGKRSKGTEGGSGERDQTLNQLLTCMDGFDSTNNVVVIAATNRVDILDSALLRAGRFDRKVVVSSPDRIGREQILRVHTRNVPLSKSVDLSRWARHTVGFTGADLANLVNEAVLAAATELDEADFNEYLDFKAQYESTPVYPQFETAVKRWSNRFQVEPIHLEQAYEAVVAGFPRKLAMNDQERRIIAAHEAGHAIVQAANYGIDSLEKVTIVPTTNGALGYTLNVPQSDTILYNLRDIKKRLMVLLAGRAGEFIAIGEYTNGASEDLAVAKDLAIQAIGTWGLGESHVTTEKTLIEKEAAALIDEAYKLARRVIQSRRTQFQSLITHLSANDTAGRETLSEIFS